ncbi:MAG: MurR/RpiR family transcriptional regulator [Blastocatellales bacterium]
MNNNQQNGQPFKERIETRYAQLGKQRQRVVKYVNDHLQTAMFLTAGQLAEKVGVDAGTVVRTAQDLGYRGYGDFIESARKCFLEARTPSEHTPYEIVQRSVRDEADPEQSVIASLHEERHNLQQVTETINPKQIVKLARRIIKARNTLIIGLDLAGALSQYMEYALLSLGLPARAVAAGGGRLRNHLTLVTKRDLVIAITFRRGLRETVEAAKEARRIGAYTVGLTDSQLSPLVAVCDEHILAPVASQSFAGSYVAPLAMINAIVVALTKCDPAHSLEALGKINKEYKSGNRWC